MNTNLKIPKSRNGETVLIVDDQSSVLMVMKMQVASLGYTVMTAGGGMEALSFIHEAAEKPALIISDVYMPEMSGPAMVQRARQLLPGVGVIYMSGMPFSATEGPFQEFPEEADELFLRKPVVTNLLAKNLSDLLYGADVNPPV